MRATTAQEFLREQTGAERQRAQRAPDARVPVEDVAEKVLDEPPERDHLHLGALPAVRAVLAGEHLPAVQAVFRGHRAADEILAMREDPSISGVAIAEQLGTTRAHPRRVHGEIRVERCLVGEPVLNCPADPAGGR